MCDVQFATFLLTLVLASDDPPRVEYPRAPRETVVVQPRTLALVKSYLTSDDPAERSEALAILRQARDSQTAEAVRKLTDDPEPNVRAQALLTLEALLPADELVPILQDKCADKSPRVSEQALAILAGVPGPDAHAALLQVRSVLPSESLANWAAALARREERPSEAIISELLDASDASVRAAAVTITERHPDSTPVSRRVTLLNDANSLVRARAINALRDAKDDRRVREAVIARLNDSSSRVRRAALEWLEGLTLDPRTVEARLEDPDSTVRTAAVRVVARLGNADTAMKLIDRLGDREVIVAQAASDQLGTQSDPRLVETLIGLLQADSDQVARLSARSLGLMKAANAIGPLQQLSDHRSEPVRAAAYEAIGRIGRSEVVPWLLDRVANESGYARAAINEALGRLKDSKSLDHLIADCQYSDKNSKGLNPALFGPRGGPPPYPPPATAVATAAVRALGELGDTRAVPVLVTVSRDILRNEAFWTGVMSSLRKLGDVRARPALVELGVVGYITQGMASVEIPASTRVEAFRALAALRITDATNEILATDPGGCALEVRRVVAEVLTELTGDKYTYRLPAQPSAYFIDDRASAAELTAFKLPICYRVDGQANE
jgi:HEAT repeat protein